MNNIDDLLKQSLGSEGTDTLTRDGTVHDQLTQLTDAFRGQTRVLSILWIVEVFAMTALGVFCAVMMFQAEELRLTVMWATAALGCGFTVGLMKIWFYMMLNRNRVVRELKRLELGISVLSDRVSGSGENHK